MSITAYSLSAATTAKQLQGTIVEISIVANSSTNSVVRFKLVKEQMKGTSAWYLSCSLKKLKEMARRLPLPDEFRQVLANGSTVDFTTSTSFDAKVTVTSPYVVPNNPNNLIPLVDIEAVITDAPPLEYDERYSKYTPVDDWPAPANFLNFMPVSVPMRSDQTRIGYAVFDNPITYISHQRSTYVDQLPALRLPGSLKKATGKAFESFTITYMANGPEEIEKSIQEVLEQICLTPFTSCEGGPFGFVEGQGDIPYHAIAVRDFAVMTVPGLPNTLQVQISFDPFNWQYYFPHSDNELHQITSYDSAICWPLVKVWSKLAGRSTYNKEPFNGVLGLYFPNEYGAKIIEDIFTNDVSETTNADYLALRTLKAKIQAGKQGRLGKENALSSKVKEVQDTGPRRTLIIKLSEKRHYDALIQEAGTNFVGLMLWSRLANANYVDDQGEYIPNSTHVSPTLWSSEISSGSPFLGKAFNDNTSDYKRQDSVVPYVDIFREGNDRASVEAQIIDFLTEVNGNPISGPNFVTLQQQIAEAKINPQNLFAIVLEINGSSENLENAVESIMNTANRQSSFNYSNKMAQLESKLISSVGVQLKGDVPLQKVLETGPGASDSDIIIESIGGSRGHRLALLSQRGDPLPLHQYTGGIDGTVSVKGKCFGSAAKKKLEFIKKEFDERAIQKKSSKYAIDVADATKGVNAGTNYLYVRNEIFSLLGISFVMPVTLHFDTVDGQPNVWDFTISFIEYSPELQKAEEVKFLPTTWANIGRYYNYGWNFENIQFNPILDRALEFFNIQSELAEEEVYPDLSLPRKGEIDFWISTIQKGATKWSESGGINALLPQFKTESEKEILRVVAEQFYPQHSQLIASSFKPLKIPLPESQSLAYAEPDFYVWYHPDDDFGGLLDDQAENSIGIGPQKDRNGKPKSGGTKDLSSAGGGTAFRQIDTSTGLSYHYATNYLSANGKNVEELRLKAIENAYPKERAEIYMKEALAAAKTIDQTENAWWKKLDSLLTVSKAQSGIIAVTPEQEEIMVTPWGIPVERFSDEVLRQDVDPILNDKGVTAFNTASSAPKYFATSWKQATLQKAFATLSKNNSYGLHSLSWLDSGTSLEHFGNKNCKFFYDNPTLLITPVDSFAVLETRDAAASLSIDEIEKGIQNYLNNRISVVFNTAQQIEQALANMASWLWLHPATITQKQILESMTLKTELSPWLLRSAIVSTNYRNIQKLTASTSWRTGIKGLMDSWNYVDKLAQKHKIDPNVIRAFVLKRDGFGAYPRPASPEIGAFDTTLELDKVKALDEICRIYAKNMNRLSQIPTIALIATQMEITTEGKAEYFDLETNEIKKDTLAFLAKQAQSIRAALRSSDTAVLNEAINALRALVNSHRAASVGIDSYYVGYITIGRIYGTNIGINLSNTDPFFHPMNRFFFYDTETNTEVSYTKFSPSGATVAFSYKRGESNAREIILNPDLPSDYAPAEGSLALEEAMGRKMRGTISPHSESNIYGSLLDFRRYAPIGKLRGAFPSFKVLLINEGFYWMGGSKKLWDQFYTRTGIASIEVFKSRNLPGATASVVFSNMFHTITNYALAEAMAHNMAVQASNQIINDFKERPTTIVGKLWSELFLKEVPEDVRKIWQNNHIKRLALTAGTRLQIRMGYGSNAASLPVVFNGNVVDAPVSEGYVTITAVSDGHELEKPTSSHLVQAGGGYAFQDGGPVGMGADPSLIVKGALITATIWDNLLGGNFRDHSSGIAHFGDQFLYGAKRYTPEIEFNIYSANKTKVESGLSELDRYNIVNGLVNWNNENNLFSVSVQEPTPWKVMEVCRRACSDFVAAAEPFAMRSTAFFGKWWWPYHYTYHESILNLETPIGYGYHTVSPYAVKTNPDGTKTPTNIPRSKLVTLYPTVYLFGSPSNILPTTNAKTKAKVQMALSGAKQGVAKAGDDSNLIFLVDATNDNIKVYLINKKCYTFVMWTPPVPDVVAPGFEQVFSGKPAKIETLSDTEFNQKVQAVSEQVPLLKKAIEEYKTYGVTGGAENPIAKTYQSTTESKKIPAEGLLDVTNLQMHLKWKPYCQGYIAHSLINLLDNSISADSRKVYTDAIGIHQYNGWVSGTSMTKTIVYSVDTDIHPSDRKTMMVDTGLLVTALQSGTKPIAAGITGKIPFLGGLNRYIEESPTTPAVENAVIGALIDQVKEMYQGWFIITGIASVKPRDFFLLNDHHVDMHGPVFVKDVVHRMDAETGFITMVSPDAVVVPHDSIVGTQMLYGMSLGPLGRIGGVWTTKAAVAGIAAALRNNYVTSVGLEILSDGNKYKEYISNIDRKFARLYITLLEKDPKDKDANRLIGKLQELMDEIKNEEAAFDATQALNPDGSPKSKGSLKFSKEQLEKAKIEMANEKRRAFMEANADEIKAFLDKNDVTGKKLADLIKDWKKANDLGDTARAADKLAEIEKLMDESIILSDEINDLDLRRLLKKRGKINYKGYAARALDNLRAGVVGAGSSIGQSARAWAQGGKEFGTGFVQGAKGLLRDPIGLKWMSGKKRMLSELLDAVTELEDIQKAVKDSPGDLDDARKAFDKAKTTFDALDEAKDGVKYKEAKEALDAARKVQAAASMKETQKELKNIVKSIRMLKFGGPQIVLSLASDLVLFSLFDSLIEGHLARLRARQCVKIIPLRVGDEPYVAGIKGHQGAVIGDDPSWVDDLVTTVNQFPLLTYTAAILSGDEISIPEYGRTEQDNAYLEDMREYYGRSKVQQ